MNVTYWISSSFFLRRDRAAGLDGAASVFGGAASGSGALMTASLAFLGAARRRGLGATGAGTSTAGSEVTGFSAAASSFFLRGARTRFGLASAAASGGVTTAMETSGAAGTKWPPHRQRHPIFLTWWPDTFRSDFAATSGSVATETEAFGAAGSETGAEGASSRECSRPL